MFKASVAACAAFLTLALFDVAVVAEDQPVAPPCALTYEAARETGENRAATQDHTKFMDFAAAEAAALLKAINETPPRSHLIADHILVLDRPDSDSVKVALFSRDCVTVGTTMNEEAWRKLKAAAIGGGI